MRKSLYVLLELLVILVLLVLSPKSVKATCSYNQYGQCTGTCSCPAGYCGGCSCVVMYGYCTSYSNCYQCPTPTTPPAPTDTPKLGASPTNPVPSNTPRPTQHACAPGQIQCGNGSCCDNGYYCCQGGCGGGTNCCCAVGSPIPTGNNGGGSNPTNTPAPTNTPTNTPTLTPSPTPIPGVWAKLKNTSFSSNRSLNSLIPAAPTAYDGDVSANAM